MIREEPNMYVKKGKPVHIVPFSAEMADRTTEKSESGHCLHYIHTREGMRLIDDSMYIATKSDDYRHPMAPEVLQGHYKPFEIDEHGEECHW